MKIAIACDHGGFPYKKALIKIIQQSGHEPIDFGEFTSKSSDYPDTAKKVGLAIDVGEVERGILLCGSGIGMCIAANKMVGVYAGICHDTYTAHQGVEHDNMNVLCIGVRVVGIELAKDIVSTFLAAKYIGNNPGYENYRRRVEKVKLLEKQK
jgi:ribose 5-phosphate isomerase B